MIPATEVIDGERKTVTALFADIKGSMELMEDLDPEEARAIVDPALKLMIGAVQHYDGFVVQSIGDGIFALFGAPVAHEDHPQRALYAALRMHEDIRRYGDRLRSRGHAPLLVRIGVNAGDVVVRSIQTGAGHAEYTPIGHSTSLAARLQALAAPGSTVISGSTQKFVEGYFQLRSLGPTTLKGVSEPIEVFEVIGLGPLRTRFQAAARRGLTKFIGRDTEMAQMRHALELMREGHGQVVAAMGEAGLGKSRLFFEFKAVAEGGCLVLEAYSVSHGKASAYLPVIGLLREYFEITSDDDARKRRERILGKVLGLDRTLENRLPYLYSLFGISEAGDSLAQMDPQIRRRRTQEGIKRILLRESLNQPLIVIFEDLHWIDDETQALLNQAAERCRDCWAAARGEPRPFAEAIDTILHHERLERGRRRVYPIPGPLAALHDGAMVVAAASAFTLYAGRAYRWTNEGYAPPERLHRADGLLTPPSTLMALSSGYRPALHPSINTA